MVTRNTAALLLLAAALSAQQRTGCLLRETEDGKLVCAKVPRKGEVK